MRIFPMRKLLHQLAKRMNMDYNGKEDTAYWKSLAKRPKEETNVLRKRVADGEASAVIDE